MFEILITIAGSLDDEAEALALAQDLEDCVLRARRLGIAVEVRNTRLAQALHKRITVPPAGRAEAEAPPPRLGS